MAGFGPAECRHNLKSNARTKMECGSTRIGSLPVGRLEADPRQGLDGFRASAVRWRIVLKVTIVRDTASDQILGSSCFAKPAGRAVQILRSLGREKKHGSFRESDRVQLAVPG